MSGLTWARGRNSQRKISKQFEGSGKSLLLEHHGDLLINIGQNPTIKKTIFPFFTRSSVRLGSVAGPVIQATGRSEFEDHIT
jgi:hypothetical protein